MNDKKYSMTDEDVALNSNATSSTEVKISSSSRHREAYSKSTRIFTLIIILLLVSCAVLIVLYTMERVRRRRAEAQNAKLNHSVHLKPNLCTTLHCVQTASVILSTLDGDVDPCDDFFLFACGGWRRGHPIPDDEGYWTQVIELIGKNFRTLKRLLESKHTREKYSKNTAVMKVLDYYDACNDVKSRDRIGLHPLVNIIRKYGSWNITQSGWVEDSWDLIQSLSKIYKDLDIKPLFSISVHADYRNSSINRIMIDQTSHAITRESYLTNSSYHMTVRHAYAQLMIDVAQLLGAKIQVADQLQEIFEFEMKLAKISIPGATDRVDKSKLYKLMTIQELTAYTDNQFDWHALLTSIFDNTTAYTLNKDEKVVVFALEYIKQLINLTRNTPERTIRNYIMWQVVVNMAPYLGPRYRRVYYGFNRAVEGSSGEIPRWQRCLTEMSHSKNEIGYPLGLVFIDEKFQKESREMVINLINDLRDVFISNLRDLDWMDEKTAQKAIEKARAIRQNIGYPDSLKDTEELNKRYEQLQIEKKSYFQNMLNLRKFIVMKRLLRLREPVDKNRWIVPPHTVNAFYDRVTNKITFPAGFLQAPFFDLNFPRAVSYGGIGIVVAHEITHGFDNNGRKYDKMGDLFNWWTNSSNDAFVRKAQCFVDQYSSKTAYGTNLNGKQTLAENIADNGAIKQAFMAYKRWVSKHGEQPMLPGLNYTNEQLFFISAAQVDCGSIRPQTALRKIETGTHTLDHWRVVIEMSNSREFSRAFKCPSGSRMNPANKCEVW